MIIAATIAGIVAARRPAVPPIKVAAEKAHRTVSRTLAKRPVIASVAKPAPVAVKPVRVNPRIAKQSPAKQIRLAAVPKPSPAPRTPVKIAVAKSAPPKVVAKKVRPVAAKPAVKPQEKIAESPLRYQGKLVRNRIRHFPDKVIALTFDDGPDKVVTPRVLKTLAAYKVQATFFVIGRQVRSHPDMLRREAKAGHAIESHSYSHPTKPSDTIAAAELEKTEELIQQVTGRTPTCFRPPCGVVHNALTRQALKDGYTVVTWTVTSADTSPRATPDTIAGNVVANLKPGDIILVHDGPGHGDTATALPTILKLAKKKGFRFVTVPELLNDWDNWLVACENTEKQRKARVRMEARIHASQRRG